MPNFSILKGGAKQYRLSHFSQLYLLRGLGKRCLQWVSCHYREWVNGLRAGILITQIQLLLSRCLATAGLNHQKSVYRASV